MKVFIFMIGIFVNATALSALIVTNTSYFNAPYNYTQLMTVEVALIENASASNWVASGFNVGRRTTNYNFDLSVSEVHTTYDGLYPDRDVYYSYDDCGRRTQMLVTEHRTRDGVSHTDSATIKYEYGPTGLMEAVVMGPSRKKITYDTHGWQVKAQTELKRSYDGNYVERLYYADTKAAHPRYNGFVSRKEWQRHAYDYEYDPNGFLIAAAYSELPGNDQATGANQGVKFDRSVSFEYDIRGNVRKIQRKGAIDRHPSGRLTFGWLDDIEATYTGNRLTKYTHFYPLTLGNGKAGSRVSDITELYDFRDVGIRNPIDDVILDGSYPVLYQQTYDNAGRLVSDESRKVADARYDNNGYLTHVTVQGNEVKYRRDGLGNLLSAEYTTPDGSGADVKGDMADRTVLYDGDGHVSVNGQLEMSRFEGGYFDAGGKPHYYLTDYQGNVVRVIDETGLGGQPMDYYPYGEPWQEWDWARADTYPSFIKNRFLYGGKERITQFGLGLYNFEARMYRAPLGRFSTPDKKAIDTPWLSPFAYCACNPVNFTDPTGMEIRGVRKQDAQMMVDDFRAMFPGKEFDNFRDLIVQSGKKQNGKSLAQISGAALSSAFSGITLNEDQQALVEMVVNTINSKDVHRVEYLTPGKEMSQSSLAVFEPKLNSIGITSEGAANMPGGYSQFIMALCGEASTTPVQSGTLTIILKSQESFLTNRSATLGHEVLGHGRTLRLGYTDPQSQHILPIQVENLILRNMNVPLYRDGTRHAPKNTFIPNYMDIPNFR